MQKLAIIIPTNNRQKTVLQTIKIYEDFFKDYLDIIFIILDSTNNKIDKKLINNKKINYIHCPNIQYESKLLLALKFIKLENLNWVLYAPDDDLFLPDKEFINSTLNAISSNKHIYIPSKYIFFNKETRPFECLKFNESWSHHVHIANSGFSYKKQIDNFVSEGVCSCWGFYSLIGFEEVIQLITKLNKIVNFNQWSIIEDFSNIFVLNYKWIKCSSYPICLRGNDRKFRNKKDIILWKVLDELKKTKEFLINVLEYFPNLFAKFYCTPIIQKRTLKN